jgi:hypothetical protein
VSFLGWNAGEDQVFGVVLQVSLELGVHFGFHSGRMQGSPKPGAKGSQEAHISSGLVLRMDRSNLADIASPGSSRKIIKEKAYQPHA